jgi:aryl-alcohol dehydrogenase-like predicted oxidoreductase
LTIITLPGTSVKTTSIGFGCSNLLGDKTREQGLDLLHAAFDAGVRHFDVARYYGFGQAESLVGEFAAGRRDQITIATKFGLQPPSALARPTGLMQIVRKAVRASPFVRRLAQRGLKAVVERHCFRVSDARASLETSLRELRTDYIDLYLLHECEPADCSAELLEFLRASQAAGKIRAFGTGTALQHTQQICVGSPGYSGVVQIRSSLISRSVRAVNALDDRLEHGRRAIITHGSMEALPALAKQLSDDCAFRSSFGAEFGLAAKNETGLAGLLLQHALHVNPGGIALFRSAVPARIAGNLRAFMNQSFSAAQLERLDRALISE